MNTTSIESIPQGWDDERDGVFFHLTAAVFTPDFCSGATVLLASYDVEDVVADDSATTLAALPSVPAAEPQPTAPSPAQHTN